MQIKNKTELKESLDNLAKVQRKLGKFQDELQVLVAPLMKKINVAKQLEKELSDAIQTFAEAQKVKDVSGTFLELKWSSKKSPVWAEDEKVVEELKKLNLIDLIRVKEEPKKNEIKDYLKNNENVKLETYKEEVVESVKIAPKKN